MVSGYCKCGFPASLRCDKCGVKLCGNCAPTHECQEVYEATVDAMLADAPALVTAYKKKPGRPPVKK